MLPESEMAVSSAVCSIVSPSVVGMCSLMLKNATVVKMAILLLPSGNACCFTIS